MLFNKDKNGNVSYTLEENELSAQDILDYWTPERKASAKPDPSWSDDRPGASDIVKSATDPQLADTSKMPFKAGGKLFFVCRTRTPVCCATSSSSSAATTTGIPQRSSHSGP